MKKAHKFQNAYEPIEIASQESVTILDEFDTGEGTRHISVKKGAKLNYLVILKDDVNLDLVIESVGESAEIVVRGLVLAQNGSSIRIKAHAHLRHNHATADLHLVSLLKDGSDSSVDGGVDLHEGVMKISGHLLEENILLGKEIKIKTLPMLDVRSSDVSASHGARIQKLNEKKMFYLRSKGLNKQQAEELMISGYIEQMFEGMKGEIEGVDELETECLEYILR